MELYHQQEVTSGTNKSDIRSGEMVALLLEQDDFGNVPTHAVFEESLELWREAGNKRGIALSQAWLVWKDEIEGIERWAFADESIAIAQETGDPWTIAWCLKAAYCLTILCFCI